MHCPVVFATAMEGTRAPWTPEGLLYVSAFGLLCGLSWIYYINRRHAIGHKEVRLLIYLIKKSIPIEKKAACTYETSISLYHMKSPYLFFSMIKAQVDLMFGHSCPAYFCQMAQKLLFFPTCLG